jgi:hypothetical protein
MRQLDGSGQGEAGETGGSRTEDGMTSNRPRSWLPAAATDLGIPIGTEPAGAPTLASCWLPASDAPVPQADHLGSTSRALLCQAALIVAPRSPARPLLATQAEIDGLEAGATEVASRLIATAAPSAQAAQFDDRFGLLRSHDENAVASGLARATAIAARLSQDPNAHPADIEAIAEGLALSIAAYAGATPKTASLPGEAEPTTFDLSPQDRWDQGHQLFGVLGQETVFTLLRLEVALKSEDWGGARLGYLDAITLFRAVGATMRCVGDMTPAQYAAVRRSMEPPNVQAGFSGLWDAGHKRILSLTRAIAKLPGHPSVKPTADRYLMAINILFHAHASVCEHVAGGLTSLASQANPTALPGHIMLRTFARRALTGAGYQMETIQ